MSLVELLKLMRKHLKIVIALPVACGLLAAAVSWFVLDDEYSASVSVYVLARSSEDTDSISNNELSASQMLTNDVATLIVSDRIMGDAAHALGLSSLDDFDISVSSSTSTRVITIGVTGAFPEDVAAVANQLAKTTDEVAREIVEVKSIKVIDEASQPSSPSGPPRMLYTIIAFLAGLLIAVAVVAFMDMVDTRVRNAEDAAAILGLPVIGRIPVMKN